MFISQRKLFFGFLPQLLILTVLSAQALAHDDTAFIADRQAPYNGPRWDPTEGGPPPITFPSSGIQLLSWLPVTQFNPAATSGNVVWGYVAPSGREYAIMGFSHGTAFVEVTNPSFPQIRSVITGLTSLWRDLKVYQNYAYAVSEGGAGIQVMSLAQIDSGIVTALPAVNTPGSSSTHTFAINESSGYLYRCGGGSSLGIRIYSLANPAAPAWVATWGPRYVHECQVVTYTTGQYAGKEIAFLYSETNSGGGTAGLDIVDVTNKSNIVPMSFLAYPGARYSHQGWTSTDRQYVYLDDEFDEAQLGIPSTTHVISIANLSAPSQVGTFTSGSTSVDHNLYTLGNYIFESNYRSGLRVFDASSDPIHPTQIAWFDTYPPDDLANYNGLWSNYPYLPSGIVLGGDIEKGLFVWRIGPPLLTFSYPSGLPDRIQPAGDTIQVLVTPQNGGALQPGTGQLHFNAGAGFIDVNLISTGANSFDAIVPAIQCGRSVSYYFTAQTTSGVVVKDPMTAPIGSYTATAAIAQPVLFEDTMETNQGWTVGWTGDNAATGIWTRVNPVGTAAQPEDDHTPGTGTLCYVTGQGVVGGALGDNDVDGGHTTLVSPVLNLAGTTNATISYWRWFSNSTGSLQSTDDPFVVDVSNNNGQSWVNVETIGPGGGVENAGGWFYHQFRVSDFVTPTAQVRVRFVADDSGTGSIVEAAIDDFQVTIATCIAGDLNGDADIDLPDYAGFAECMAGPNVSPNPAAPPPTATDCLDVFDLNNDSDVDLLDLADFEAAFTGP